MATNKPNLNRIWASSADPGNIIDPDVGQSGKFNNGWIAELPPFEYFNFMYKLFTEGLAHMNEQGIPVWDTETTYPLKAWSKGSNGEVYEARVETTGNNPISSVTQWLPLADKFKSREIHKKIITTSGSWTVPTGVTKLLITVIGAGGGGAGGDDGNTAGRGQNGTDASNTSLSYASLTITAIGGKRGQGVGQIATPDIPTPPIVGGSGSGTSISTEIIPGGGSVGGVGGVGQTLAVNNGNQGGTGGTGGTGGKVIVEIAVSGGSVIFTIGNPGLGGAGNSSNSSNNGSDGSPSYVEITYLQ